MKFSLGRRLWLAKRLTHRKALRLPSMAGYGLEVTGHLAKE